MKVEINSNQTELKMGFYCCFKRLKFIHVFNIFQFDDLGYNA